MIAKIIYWTLIVMFGLALLAKAPLVFYVASAWMLIHNIVKGYKS